MINSNHVPRAFVRKKNLSYYVAAFSCSVLAASNAAMAQQRNDSDVTMVELEEVVVTGLRSSLETAQTLKREAEQVVDSITSVDIGALPDRSVAEALQRIPGVQLQRTNSHRDPARLAAEGGGVFVRGLSWVRTELNGRDIYSASNGQSLGFEDVSADLMAGVDVYKNPSADMVEGGLGGIVNLRTRKPFDSDGFVLAGSADYNYADMLEQGFGSFSAIASTRWNAGSGEMGFLVSASRSNIGNRTDSLQTGRYESSNDNDATPDVDESQFVLPTGLGFRRIDWEQEREAISSSFQWAPSEQLSITVEALYAESNPVDVEYSTSINGRNGLNYGSGEYQFDTDNVVRSGELSEATLTMNTRFGERHSSTGDYSVKIEYSPSEKWTLSADVQYIESEASILSMTAFTQPALDRDTIVTNAPEGTDNEPLGTNAPTVEFNLSSSDPFITVGNQNLLAQQDEYWWAAAMDHVEDNEADSVAVKLDGEYFFDQGQFLNSFRFGARATEKTALTRQTGYNWGLLSNQYWKQSETPAFLDAYLPAQASLMSFDNFMRGEASAPSVGWFPSASLLSDNKGAYQELQTTQINGPEWRPLDTPSIYYDLNPSGDNISAGINEQLEQTNAVYGLLRFGSEAGTGFDGNIGVRLVKTQVSTRGRANAKVTPDGCGNTEPTSEDCAGVRAFSVAYNDEFGGYKDFKNTYTEVLPSLNLRFFLQEGLQLRLGASRGMVRPGFSQTRPYQNLDFKFEGDEFDPDVTSNGYEGTITSGASNLKPTTADQVDASIEWYFDESGSLTFAAFAKNIKDYIAVVNTIETLTSGGQTYNFLVTKSENSESGKLRGFELAYQQFYDNLPSFLDGFGLQANFTYIDNNGGANTAVNVFETQQAENAVNNDLPVEGMSKTSYNIALLYEKHSVSARLAYNWRERYLLTTSAANLNVPTWMNDYGQLDGSIFYTVNDHLKFGVQATNLLTATTRMDVGFTALTAPYSWTQTDRRVAFVVRAKF